MDPVAEERLCHETTSQTNKFTLPDGRQISLNDERYLCPEALFEPHKIGVEAPGIAEITFRAINKAPVDTRTQFYENIVLSGGTTMFPGLPTRMHKEMSDLYVKHIRKGEASKIKINIEDPPRRKHMVFQGGSVLAGITEGNPDWWISKAEWEEHGASII